MELEELNKKEQELDLHRSWIQQSICNITEDLANKPLAFVTHEDVCQCFKGDTLLGIQAPAGTHLEVPLPDSVSLSLPEFLYKLGCRCGY